MIGRLVLLWNPGTSILLLREERITHTTPHQDMLSTEATLGELLSVTNKRLDTIRSRCRVGGRHSSFYASRPALLAPNRTVSDSESNLRYEPRTSARLTCFFISMD